MYRWRQFLTYLLMTGLWLGPSLAQAELRVFLLRIYNLENEADERFVRSRLDPLQYPSYYPLPRGYGIEYVDTWMCRGRTGDFRPYCDPPPEREPAAEADLETDELQ